MNEQCNKRFILILCYILKVKYKFALINMVCILTFVLVRLTTVTNKPKKSRTQTR